MRFYKLLLQKAYFDKGLGVTNYFKYLIAFFGIASNDAKTTLMIGFIYGICCYFIGLIWYKFKIIETENEVQNRFNLFQVEVREKINTLSGADLKQKI